MKIQIKEISLLTPNGNDISLVRFSSKIELKETIVISSATGVLQRYYAKFAEYLALQGFTVYTFDYSGIGKSIDNPKLLEKQSNLKSWGSNDQAAVVAFAKSENSESQLTLITHSVGGQLLGFNPHFDKIDKVIMVASQGGYWKDFKGIHLIKMWLFWYIIIPSLTPIFGYFPSKKLGLFENLPKNMVYEWASWGRKKKYMIHFHNDHEYFFDRIKAPILSWSFPKDSFAPKKTVDWLASQYKNAEITRVHFPIEEQNQPRHFGFFKPEFKELLWEQNINWILTNSLS